MLYLGNNKSINVLVRLQSPATSQTVYQGSRRIILIYLHACLVMVCLVDFVAINTEIRLGQTYSFVTI